MSPNFLPTFTTTYKNVDQAISGPGQLDFITLGSSRCGPKKRHRCWDANGIVIIVMYNSTVLSTVGYSWYLLNCRRKSVGNHSYRCNGGQPKPQTTKDWDGNDKRFHEYPNIPNLLFHTKIDRRTNLTGPCAINILNSYRYKLNFYGLEGPPKKLLNK